ncbi:MAG: MaoC family dehydratase N-terminal domain-containing protein [Firmicutes bacterium]|nr:MaoC family dehydratase N-terminal domain-containing protein [Bacillota bacterium]
MSVEWERLEVGRELPPVEAGPVSRSQLAAYAEASGDRNPIHLDDEVARAYGLEGVIIHGMLGMGLLGRALGEWLGGAGWVRSFEVRFARMIRPGVPLTARGRVTALRGGQAELELWLDPGDGSRPTRGRAVVELERARSAGGAA